MPIKDNMLRRLVRREFIRRHVDSSLVEVSVVAGVAYLAGVLRAIRNEPVDLKEEIQTLEQLVRAIPGIRDVVNELEVEEW
jgi:osmotically-inducible protein OsmY